MTDKDLESLFIESYLDLETFEPLVRVKYQGKEVLISSTEATQKAIAILNAAAYAEGEVAFFKILTPDKPKKGFGKPVVTEEYRKALMLLEIIRQQRQPLPKGVNGIFGFNTQEPLVDLDYGEFRTQLYLDDARNHAAVLMQASEAARFDAFWFKFGKKELDMSDGEIQAIINEYRIYKERYSIESMFYKG